MLKIRHNALFYLLICTFFVLTLSSCSRYKEPAPFFNGLFFKYKAGNSEMSYTVEQLSDGRFKIVQTILFTVLNDEIEEFFTDQYGRVYKSSVKDYEGGFTDIWIPVHKMKIGDRFDNYVVIKKSVWKGWKVLVVKNTVVGGESYFDLSTGFLVGSISSGPMGPFEIVLVDTNSSITIEEGS